MLQITYPWTLIISWSWVVSLILCNPSFVDTLFRKSQGLNLMDTSNTKPHRYDTTPQMFNYQTPNTGRKLFENIEIFISQPILITSKNYTLKKNHYWTNTWCFYRLKLFQKKPTSLARSTWTPSSRAGLEIRGTNWFLLNWKRTETISHKWAN